MHTATSPEHDPMPGCLEAMRRAQREQGEVGAALRIDRLSRLLRLLDRHAEAFCTALDADFGGRSRETSLMNDLLATATSVRYARANLRRWMRPERRGGVFPFNIFGGRVEVRHDPKGVVGVLGTWNVPLFTTLAPLAFVLAAGNRAMLKPSEWVPRTSALLAEAVGAEFGEDELAVFTGGPEVAARFSALPFDHLVLTGSARTGRLAMQAAAANLVPVTLELGGKSPVLVGRSADLPLAAHRIVLGKIMNSGQICVAPDVVHVPAERLEDFLGHCVDAFQRAFAAPGARGLRYMPTALVGSAPRERIAALLAEASARGVRLVRCGESGDGGTEPGLTLAIDPPADTRLAREEIFGPVLQVQTYGEIDEAIGRVNDNPSPLALYYFGRDRNEQQRVLDRTRSGGVTVNDVLMHVAAHDAPFGGVGGSGMGCYHGREGFLEFSHARTVYRSGWWDPRRTLGLEPPYDARTYARLRGTLRR